MRKFVKDPGGVLDYTFDWSDFLAEGETITEKSVVSDTPALVVDSATANGQSVTAWLSGGEIGDRVFVTCRITTSAGREDDRSIYVWVANT